MGTRRIPIRGQPAEPRPEPAQLTPWQSSLELVFSYHRSQAFRSLPSSPSFVARYRRPGFPDDEEASLSFRSDERDQEGITTGDDGEGALETTEDEWSEEDREGERVPGWEHEGAASPGQEQLPPNAVGAMAAGRVRKGRLRYASSDRSSTDFGPATLNVPKPASRAQVPASDERSPLLNPGSNRHAIPAPFRTRLAYPAPGESPRRYNSPNNGGSQSMGRRLSIVSSQAWQEAVDENRGQSTYGQTLFNTVNVLVGIGLLAEPLAFADAGWVLGSILLVFCALITNYTAKMLAKAMACDSSLQTYADVLIKAFGNKAKSFVHFMFVLELGALSIALVVLFSDSMATLYPSWSSTSFKLLSYIIIVPTTFLPLRFLSITSLLGILSSFTLLCVLIADGSIKSVSPGSLHMPMPTAWSPRWARLPLSFGLFMSGFSGHAVIPSLYRDMKDPQHFNSMIDTAYVIACIISAVMGIIGYLMFGNTVTDEVTQDMLMTPGYPPFLNELVMWMVALSPLCKYGIGNRPLVATIEHMLGMSHTHPPSPRLPPTPISRSLHPSSSSLVLSNDSQLSLPLPLPPSPIPFWNKEGTFFKLLLKPVVTAIVVLLSIVIPEFGRVLSFLGAFSAFGICCIGPIGAYLILGRSDPIRQPHRLKSRFQHPTMKVEGIERVLCWVLLGVSIVLAASGTVWTFLPTVPNEP